MVLFVDRSPKRKNSLNVYELIHSPEKSVRDVNHRNDSSRDKRQPIRTMELDFVMCWKYLGKRSFEKCVSNSYNMIYIKLIARRGAVVSKRTIVVRALYLYGLELVVDVCSFFSLSFFYIFFLCFAQCFFRDIFVDHFR